jgi:hypothetical protein
MSALAFVCVFTALIHFAEATALSMRLAGVYTRQVASSISFVNIAFLIARLSNMLQAPLLGAMVDAAVNPGSGFTLVRLEHNFRMIIFAAFIGNLAAAIFIPTFAEVFRLAIGVFEREGSMPRVLARILKPSCWKVFFMAFWIPTPVALKKISLKNIPREFLWLNFFIVAIYSVGVLASLFAGAMLPGLRATAGQLSGIVNGIATVLFVILVDPQSAHITDQIVKGKRPESDMQSIIFFLVLGRILGTLLLAQMFLLPAAHYIKTAAVWVAGWVNY